MEKLTCQWQGCPEPLTPPAKQGRRPKWCAAHRVAEHRRTANIPSRDQCTTDGCQRPLKARGMCNPHYKQWARAEGRIAASVWDDRRRNNHHARRARMNGASNGDRAMLADIIARDGLNCARCHLPVDITVAWPDRHSKSIDHRQPLSRGGAHSLDNTQLMHLGCNSSKGNRAA